MSPLPEFDKEDHKWPIGLVLALCAAVLAVLQRCS
jgi:hypothetical protein